VRFLNKCWRVARWVLLALLLLLIGGFFFYALPKGAEQAKTEQAVARIHATKLTWNDIFEPLPPVPDPTLNNATLAGVDSNDNGIRDDVEIAIYNEHKNSARVTAGELQYAKELQMEFTDVTNSATLVAVMQEESGGFLCIDNDAEQKEVENLVFNTDLRKNYREKIFNEYYTSWGIPDTASCNVDPKSLPN
jgi:hypothetical protein